MVRASDPLVVPPFVLRLPSEHALTEEQFYELGQRNPELRLERTAEGELIIMEPEGGDSGGRNFAFITRLGAWAEQDGQGKGFGSSTGFRLPDGAIRSPDAAWVRHERWQRLTPEERRKFPPLSPDFAAEILSPTDDLEMAQAKMREYIDNGVRLGWLFDPERRRVFVYRAGSAVEVLDDPERLDGGPVLPGFVFDPRILFS